MTTEYRVTAGMKLYEQVLEQIKTMICREMYKKGDLLPSEKELMEMTGVSRITVREALRQLSEAGVIETRKGKGSYMLMDSRELSAETDAMRDYRADFVNSTNARMLLEPAIARELAQTATPEELEILGGTLKGTPTESQFHETLIAMTHNPILTDLFQRMSSMENAPALSTLVPPAKQKSVVAVLEEQHRKIFQAIQAKKSEHAYFYMKEHLEYVQEMYEEYFDIFF